MNRSTVIAAVLSAAMISSALVSGVAFAQDRTPDQMNVSVARLDLNKASDAQTAYAKIRAAAHDVCTSDSSDPRTANDDRACEQQAVTDAVRSLHSEQLARQDHQSDEEGASALAMNVRKTR